MQWHGYDEVCFGEQSFACSRHEPCHEQRGLMPVAVFEPMNDRFRRIIIGDRCARSAPWRRIGECGRTHLSGSGIIRERNPEPRTAWFFDEAQRAPASRAKRARFADGLAANKTMRRHQKVAKLPKCSFAKPAQIEPRVRCAPIHPNQHVVNRHFDPPAFDGA